MISFCCSAPVEYKTAVLFGIDLHKYYANGYAVCQGCGEKCEICCDFSIDPSLLPSKDGERMKL